MPSGRPSKRRKRDDPSTPRSTSRTSRTSLPNLPLELLAEILLQTCSPPTVLAVSRTCTFLYRTLVQNPAAAFIWRDVRLSFGPHDLDDFGPKWKTTKALNEAQCVARMFSFERCEVCRRPTRGLYVSFAVQITLCQSWHCRRKFLRESLVDLNRGAASGESERASVWVPHVESTACFRGPFTENPVSYPHVHLCHKYVRKSDWEKYRHDFAAYEAADNVHERAGGADVSSEEDENERLMERCNAAIERFFSIMEISAELHKWRVDYERIRRSVTVDNRAWTKKLAETEGWNLRDLTSTQAYGSLQNCKNFSLERLTQSDVRFIRSDIESELLMMQARHRCQTSEAAYKKKLADLKTIYERMRAGTWGDTSDANTKKPLALPPWDMFCTLPSVRLLKGSPDPNAVVSASNDLKSSSLATSLIVADVHMWRAPVEAYLMDLLGYPNGWQSASSRMLPPLERVTARFFCRRCGEGKVGRAYQRERCLDFKGVCAHVCKGTPNKNKGGKKMDWKVDVFERDEKAIRIIKIILQLAELPEESPTTSTASLLGRGNDSIRCRSCQGWILMDFETAIGHAHRHEAMEIDLFVVPGLAKRLDLGRVVTVRVKPSAAEGISERRGFERGTTELLLGRTARARNLRGKDNYVCKRCPGARAMNFNGLRSHVKEKHGIRDMGDEDYVCRAVIGSD